MDSETGTDAWAQLVSLTDLDTSPVLITKSKFVIGRINDCDLPHTGNKLVSGRHCYIERDEKGKVWLYDTSTNGTLLNLSIKLSKGECRELHHGDEIHIVHKKDKTEDDIAYVYQDMEALRAENSSDAEDTQVIQDPDSTLPDEDVNNAETPSPAKKRKSEEMVPGVCKKIKSDLHPIISSSTTPVENSEVPKSSVETEKKTGESHKPGQSTDQSENKLKLGMAGDAAETKPAQKVQEPEDDAIAETLVCIICQELLHDCISLQPCMHSFCAGCYSEWMEKSNECPSCRLKVDRINKNHIVNNLVEAYLKLHPEKKRPEDDIKELNAKNKITRDMLYPVKNPRGFDSDEGSASDYSDEEDEEDVTANVVTEAFNFNFNNNYVPGGQVFGIGTPFFGTATNRAARPVCRQCPNYQNQQDGGGLRGLVQGAVAAVRNAVLGQGGGGAGPSTTAGTGTTTTADGAALNTAAAAGPSTGAGPSTSGAATPTTDPDAKKFPDVPDFTCAINANHVLCLCCMQPMPDRRNQFNPHNGMIPPQQCFLCYRSFCHAYWGCLKADCNGCLAKFKDLNFGKKCLASLILDNAYESEVFKDYLEKEGLSVKDVFAECVAKMVTGEYPCTDKLKLNNQHGINTPVCYSCGLRSFKEMAYYYRVSIPNEELPGEVTSRSNCYWGKNCRTQRNKPDHAKRFNHICDQTRTT